MLAEGTLAGRYEIGQKLGEGATATVYVAEDRILKVQRAVKVLKPTVMGVPGAPLRMLTEARAMARMAHPHILQVLDVQLGHDPPFLVTELLSGRTLHHVLQEEGAVGWERAIAWAVQVLEALTAAHDAGVVHRDIKPGNVLLDEEGNIKLSDFGIARLTDVDDGLTLMGAALGTFAYMPPEQRIDARSVGPAADIYGAGAMLFHLASGRSAIDMFAEPPDGARWKLVPPPIDEVLRRALHYDAGLRYQSATAFARALERALEQCENPEISSDVPADLDDLYSDHDLPEELILWFRGTLSDRRDRLDEAVAEQDTDEIRLIAHGLKGSAASYGFSRLGEIAATVLLPDKQVDLSRLPALREMLDRLALTPRDQPSLDEGTPGSQAPVILLAEDDEAMVTAVIQMLTPAYRVEVVRDGLQVLKQIDRHRPDLVLLDMNLPGRSGFELLADIKERTSIGGIPVVMLTAETADAMVSWAFEHGADDYVTKPPRPGELRGRIRRLIRDTFFD